MTTWLESSSTERPQWRPETDTVTSHGRAVVLLEWESDFALLATERAKKVKEYILQTGKVEPERVFLAEESVNGAGSKGSRVYLHLR